MDTVALWYEKVVFIIIKDWQQSLAIQRGYGSFDSHDACTESGWLLHSNALSANPVRMKNADLKIT